MNACNTLLSGISSMATRDFLAAVVDLWGARGGIEVRFESVGGVDAARRVQGGEVFDVVVLAADAIEALVVKERLLADSVVPLTRSDVAVAVPEGAARPDIATEDALRRAVLAARRLGYSTGPSGRALQSLFARWGVADALQGRLLQAPPGVAVATLLQRGEVDLGFQQLSELIERAGVDIVGAMPPGAEIITTFSGGICAESTQKGAARALLDFIRSPALDGARRAHGLQPA